MNDGPNDLKTIAYSTAVRRSHDKTFRKTVDGLKIKVMSWLESSSKCDDITEKEMSQRRLVASRLIEGVNLFHGRIKE